MKKIAILFLLVSNISVIAQIVFEEGYFIRNSNEKVSCLIKNNLWHDNPITFEYKLHKGDNVHVGSIETVKEFGLGEKLKFVGVAVNIDRSTDDLQKMKYNRNPKFHEEKLFLQVLVEGKASLYQYKQATLKRYFFTTDKVPISQLVFKRYIGPKDSRSIDKDRIKQNERFKQQLWSAMSCESIEMKDINILNYKKKELVKFFNKYNECVGTNYKDFVTTKNKKLISWSVIAGVTNSGINIRDKYSDDYNISFDKETTGSIGVEAEMILPFNKNRWSFYTAPVYQNYNSETAYTYVQTSTITKVMQVNAVYKSIEVPFGFRYSIISKDNSRFYLNTALVYDFPMNSSIVGERKDLIDFDIISSRYISFGLGYRFKDKYIIDLNYSVKKAFTDVANLTTEFESISLSLGYKVF